MQKNKELVCKPNQTIMITNKNITVNQRKSYNVILRKAWNDLKINPNQVLFEFNISELKQKAGIKATDNWHIKNSIKVLSDIKIENVKENGDWSIFSLISSAEKIGDNLVIELPFRVREALINNTYYTTLDLLIIRSLEGKYAVPIYEMAIRYQKKQIPEMPIEEFRLLTGTIEHESYNNFNNFQKKVLTPAINEINAKTDILLDYSTSIRGKKTVTIKFTVKSKENKELGSTSDEISATSEITPGQMTLDEALNDAELKGNISKILEPLGVDPKLIEKYDVDIEQLKRYVEIILKNKKSAETPTGLLIYAIRNNLVPEAITQILRSQKKTSNRDNFDQREYTDDYFDNFFVNQG